MVHDIWFEIVEMNYIRRVHASRDIYVLERRMSSRSLVHFSVCKMTR
jgi:hypothetical protein